MAAIALSKQEEFETKKQAKSNIKTAICAVADLLGNTPAVCRKCYVHPVIVEAYLNRTRIAGLNGDTKSLVPPNLRVAERAVLNSCTRENRKGLQKSHRLSFAMLHLVRGALARIFVRSPPQESCAVSKPAAGKMIVADFYDNFWRDWFPFSGALRAPAARPPGALPVKPGGFFSRSNFSVNARRSDALNPEINPT